MKTSAPPWAFIINFMASPSLETGVDCLNIDMSSMVLSFWSSFLGFMSPIVMPCFLAPHLLWQLMSWIAIVSLLGASYGGMEMSSAATSKRGY